MTMATVSPWDRKAFTATLAVERADPTEGLTCLLCLGPSVEWTVSYLLPGRRVWAGIHERCIRVLEDAPKEVAGRELLGDAGGGG